MQETIKQLIEWLHHIEMRAIKGHTLDGETALFKLSTMKMLTAHNELLLLAIRQEQLALKLQIKRLKDEAKKANKDNDPRRSS